MKSALPPEALIDRTYGAPVPVARAVEIIDGLLKNLNQTDPLLASWHTIQVALSASPIVEVAYPNVEGMKKGQGEVE
ncbi:hypothetical protein DLP3_120 [Stenotrophomonas phage vB_SmaS_DLP_3]|nr:hypothetical protein DLP3_120 [Stenotrophomonas phage vB_SmaS_DLP_3]